MSGFVIIIHQCPSKTKRLHQDRCMFMLESDGPEQMATQHNHCVCTFCEMSHSLDPATKLW